MIQNIIIIAKKQAKNILAILLSIQKKESIPKDQLLDLLRLALQPVSRRKGKSFSAVSQ
jgi:hypothetical protein